MTVKRAEAFLKGIKDEVPLNRNSLRYMAESSEGFRRMLCSYYLPSEYKNLDFSKVRTEFPSFGRGGEKRRKIRSSHVQQRWESYYGGRGPVY